MRFADKRALRRRYAILGVLAWKGRSHEPDLVKALGRGPGTIYPDLAWMEKHNLISSFNEDGTEPRRRIYSLPEKAPLPQWVYDFVAVVDRWEDEHAKGQPCLGQELTTMVPAEVRRHARENGSHEPVTQDLQKRHII